MPVAPETRKNYMRKWRESHPNYMKDWKIKNENKVKFQAAKASRKWHGNQSNLDKKAERQRLRNYGVTKDWFSMKLQTQNNACAICLRPFRRARDANIDHDHKTGALRDLLCSGCNRGIGFFRESEEALGRAINYLRAHNI